jgi:hypothetical protein
MTGDHTAYALVDVREEEEARDLVPTFLLNKAQIIEVRTFTLK